MQGKITSESTENTNAFGSISNESFDVHEILVNPPETRPTDDLTRVTVGP